MKVKRKPELVISQIELLEFINLSQAEFDSEYLTKVIMIFRGKGLSSWCAGAKRDLHRVMVF